MIATCKGGHLGRSGAAPQAEAANQGIKKEGTKALEIRHSGIGADYRASRRPSNAIAILTLTRIGAGDGGSMAAHGTPSAPA
jgi:hypothetical protein